MSEVPIRDIVALQNITGYTQERAAALATAMLDLGWAGPEHVRALVHAAGGKVVVPLTTMVDPPEVLTVYERDTARVFRSSYLHTTRPQEENKVPGHTRLPDLGLLEGQAQCSCGAVMAASKWSRHIEEVRGEQ